jgi:hypothetical protein
LKAFHGGLRIDQFDFSAVKFSIFWPLKKPEIKIWIWMHQKTCIRIRIKKNNMYPQQHKQKPITWGWSFLQLYEVEHFIEFGAR